MRGGRAFYLAIGAPSAPGSVAVGRAATLYVYFATVRPSTPPGAPGRLRLEGRFADFPVTTGTPVQLGIGGAVRPQVLQR